MSLVRNEQTKLTASLMNTISGAIFITGVVAPVVASSYDLPGLNRGWSAISASLVWIVLGGVIHAIARHLLRKLQP